MVTIFLNDTSRLMTFSKRSRCNFYLRFAVVFPTAIFHLEWIEKKPSRAETFHDNNSNEMGFIIEWNFCPIRFVFSSVLNRSKRYPLGYRALPRRFRSSRKSAERNLRSVWVVMHNNRNRREKHGEFRWVPDDRTCHNYYNIIETHYVRRAPGP